MLAIFLTRSYWLRVEDSRPLDELADDLPTNNVDHDHVLDSRGVHPIIQSCGPASARRGRKPGAQGCRLGDQLADEHVRALRAASEAALPGQLGMLARGVGVARSSEHLVESGRSAAITTFGTAADDDLEAPSHLSRAYPCRQSLASAVLISAVRPGLV